MARPTRIDFPGAWYHVLNRGIEKRLIFRSRLSVMYTGGSTVVMGRLESGAEGFICPVFVSSKNMTSRTESLAAMIKNKFRMFL
jgi:hypothetical protein